MTTPELAYTEMEKLVTNFKSMPVAQRKGLNEMQTRLGYILPLFRALGWDTSNINEVSPDEKVSRGSVDFSFRISNITRQKRCQSMPPDKDLDQVHGLERQIKQVDEEIDGRVYELYGLTEEEIRIIEGG
jgi:hypothetical protein